MKFLRKLFKFLAALIFVIVVVVNLVILFTGRFYLYKAIPNTIFKGRFGPSIEEYGIFANRKVDIGKPRPWDRSTNYNKKAIPDSLVEQMKKMQTAAFVVIKNDSLLHEQYWDGHSDTSHTNSFSMGKSITSILCGIAIEEGKIKSVDEKVGNFIPQYKQGMDSLLTIKDLLEMGSGINFNESYISPFAYPAEAYYSSDIMEWTLKYKVDTIPGKRFIYLSGNTTILGYCISKATGKSLAEYASEKLWKPLGAEQPAYWSLDHEGGVEKAYCCFNSNARDFARIGQLYLDSGKCKDHMIVDLNKPELVISDKAYLKTTWVYRQLVPKDWVVASTTPKLTAYYGYQWWIMNYEHHIIPYCRGLKGQYIFVIPDKKMVVVRLGSEREIVKMVTIDGKLYNIPQDALLYLKTALQIYGN
jgi:CubicO group peptidase (beta-lactamase class C family)